jgi:hypothetical protein
MNSKEVISKEMEQHTPPDKMHADQPLIELIRFDRKTKMFIGICSFLFVFFVTFKLHNSSVGYWNSQMPGGHGDRIGIVAGDPLPIRSDEWLVTTPFTLSQEKNHYPVTNESLGYGKIPLIMGLPAYHLLSMIKPSLWGYYFLDNERAFAWQWNFKIFPFLIAVFLFLMLFTRNNFMVSVVGSCWLFLSSSIQWWSINTEIFTYGLLTITALLYILYSNKTKLIILNGVVFILAAYSFAMILYPPYQIPFAYFLMALLAGYILSRKDLKQIWLNKWVKLSVLAVSGLCLLLLMVYFFEECKDTIKIITNTVYPGKRSEIGGNITFLNMFHDNYSWWLTPNSFPVQWVNSCELSSYLMLWPIVVILILYSFAKTRRIDPLLMMLLLFIAVVNVWLLWGFPEWLAKLSMFSTSPGKRTLFVFGFANIVFTIIYLGRLQKPVVQNPGQQKMAIHFAIIFGAVFLINYLVNKRTTDAHFTKTQIFNATIFAAVLNWLILYFAERKIFQQLCYAVIMAFVAGNLFINPLSKGLSPIFENEIYKTVSEIEAQDPGQQWVVFGHMFAPNFLKAAGIKCYNGVQFAPRVNKLHVLDPDGSRSKIYNRYAHIMFLPFIEGKDSVDFVLQQDDYYHVKMNPCSPRFKQMGIKYIMFAYRPPEMEVRSMSFVKETFGFYIYKRNDL